MKRNLQLLVMVLFTGFGLISCTGDNATPGKAVEPDLSQLPAEPPGTGFNAEMIFFAFDRSDLTAEDMKKLDALAAHLKAHSASLEVQGHCDARGTVEYNLSLGERRAESVKKYLVNLGVDAAKLRTISYGKERPLVEGQDEASWAKNRRAEFVLSAK